MPTKRSLSARVGQQVGDLGVAEGLELGPGEARHPGSLPEPASGRYRPTVMRRLLGTVLPSLLLVTVLASGCGDDEADTATDDPTPSASDSPTPTDTPPQTPTETPTETPTDAPDGDQVDFELVDTITVTAAGGAVMPTAIPISDEASVAGFNAQFESDDMVQQVKAAVAHAVVPDGQELYAAVVAIGCDSPTDVNVTGAGAGLVITAVKVPNPQMECFAPMTTVALVVA